MERGGDDAVRWVSAGNCTVQHGLQLDSDRLLAYREDGRPVQAAEVRSTCPSCQPPPDQPHIMEVRSASRDLVHLSQLPAAARPAAHHGGKERQPRSGPPVPDQPHIMEINNRHFRSM